MPCLRSALQPRLCQLRIDRSHQPVVEIEQLDSIRKNFADIKQSGEFTLASALPVERDEPALRNLHRLVFAFNRKDHGRLRQLINYLNDLPA